MHLSHLSCLTTTTTERERHLPGQKALAKFTLPLPCICYKQIQRASFNFVLQFESFLVNCDAELYRENREVIS